MLVKVEAARREGSAPATIYDKPISETHIEVLPGEGLQISFVASGIYGQDRHNARYRYTVVLATNELAILISTS
ncbi:hypothetical protein Brsp01_52660 [Brucella sp. NBRC 12950]|nr:hypothetical protein Brsp01_52660 [Brucella sp. NBRC 12950]